MGNTILQLLYRSGRALAQNDPEKHGVTMRRREESREEQQRKSRERSEKGREERKPREREERSRESRTGIPDPQRVWARAFHAHLSCNC